MEELFSALAFADLRSLETSKAIGEVRNCNKRNASLTFYPLIKSMTGLTFLTETPVFLTVAVVVTKISCYLTSLVSSVLRVEWPLKIRVGANSPNLCPTIFSEMKIGTWRLPS